MSLGMSESMGQSDDNRVAISMRVQRDHFYWFVHFLSEVFFIVFLASVSFYVSVDSFADRMGIVLTLLLTLVAFKTIISEQIPRSCSVTLLDIYMFISYFMLLLVTIQSIICATFVPSKYWVTIDIISTIVFLTFWISFHIWIVVSAKNHKFSIEWRDLRDFGNDPMYKICHKSQLKYITL